MKFTKSHKLSVSSKRVVAATLLLSLMGCQLGVETPVVPTDDQQNKAFFDVVYRASSTRADSAHPWITATGLWRMKYIQSDDASGKFIMSFSSYVEPQFCLYGTDCLCTGNVNGGYQTASPGSSSPSASSTGYNPMDPYVGTGAVNSTSDNVPSDVNAKKIFSYYYALKLDQIQLSPGCSTSGDRNVTLSRFTNGEVIMKDGYREIYFQPEIR